MAETKITKKKVAKKKAVRRAPAATRRYRVAAAQERRVRAGMLFGPEPTVVELTDAQRQAIEADPVLSIDVVED